MVKSKVLSSDEVRERVFELREAHAPWMRDRIRIRQIMNGGSEAIVALLGQKAATKLGEEDLPVVHLMDSGLTRLAQRLGRAPDVKVDPVSTRDTTKGRKEAQKRENILAGLDYQTRFELTLPYAGRWLPGYAFVPWVIVEGSGRNGQPYAKAEIRNSFDCYPGQWGPDSQPEEMAFIRLASKKRLRKMYPQYHELLQRNEGRDRVMSPAGTWGSGFGGGGGIWSPGRPVWEGPATSDAVMLAEYMDCSGTYLMTLDHNLLVDFIPNPLESGPSFVLARRPSFDQLKGQYDHVVGLMAMMAKLNVLAYIANEDAVFRETNIIGDLVGSSYRRGRFATNFFTPGTRIEKPSNDISFQVFNQIDRIERQMRIGTNYSVVQDSESPNSFATGRGLDKLTDSASANIAEYQLILRHAIELLDSRRLEWEQKMYGNRTKQISANVRGLQLNEEYRPRRDIDGNFETRRVYGVMAGWDEPDKIVTGLQLLQGEIIDRETMQENMDGLENIGRINERIRRRKTEDRLFDVLSQRAAEGDPRAEMTLVEIMKDPEKMSEVLAKFYTPEEPEMSPEEQMMAAGMAPPGAGGGPPAGPGAGGAPPEAVSTVLSRLMSGGQADAGVQTVGRL